MERLKFIRGIYSKFIIQYIILSFIILYILAYLIKTRLRTIERGQFYNPLTTNIYTTTTENITNKHNIEYFLKYTNRGIINEITIPKNIYESIKNIDYKNKKETYTIEFNNGQKLNTKQIIDIYDTKNTQKTTKTIKESKTPQEIKNRHITLIKDIYTDIIFLILFFTGLIIYLYKKYQLHDYITLPYDYNIFQIFGSENKPKKVYDKFIKKDKKGQIFYKNMSKTNYDLYTKERENIKQKLRIDKIEIQRHGKNQIIIKEVDLITKMDINFQDLQENKIYLGYQRGNTKKYLDIKGLNHTLLIGESGSGKSVFVQNLLLSFFNSQQHFTKFIMVDPKMVELSRYRKFKKVEYYEKMEDILQMFRDLQREMYSRLEEMRQNEEVKSKKPFILLLVDEFRTLKNNSLDPKENKEIEKILIDLIQKCRRTNIRIILRGQKCDTQNISSNVLRNIQSKILMKTDTNDNITKTIGRKETLENYNLTIDQIKQFNKGRGIYRDGDTGEVILFQRPFFNIEDERQKNFMYSLLELKEENNTILNNRGNKPRERTNEENNPINDNINNNNSLSLEQRLFNLEIKRKFIWDSLKNDKTSRGKELRKKLFQVKKMIDNKDINQREIKLKEIQNIIN